MAAASRPRSLPDRDRGTVNARFRVLRETNDLVTALADRLGDTKTNVAVALARVGARHEAELTTELQRLRENRSEK